MPRDDARRLGGILLLTVVLAWGLTWPVNKVILATVPPLWAVALRTGIGAGALFAIAALQRRLALPPRQDLPVLASIALLHMVGFGALSSIGLQTVPTGRSVVLAYTTPLWVVPGAALFLRERLTPRRIVGVVVGLAGLGVLFNPLALDWTERAAVLGNLAILVAALLWAGTLAALALWRRPFRPARAMGILLLTLAPILATRRIPLVVAESGLRLRFP